MRTLQVSVFWGGCLLGGPVAAEQSAYKNFLIGERAAGMGGAFVAIADDPSGVYHNPAGLAWGDADYFSLSTNAFQSSSATYEGVFGANRNYNISAGALTPSFFGFTQSLGPGRFAFAVIVEDFQLTNQNDLIESISTAAEGLKSYSRQLTREEAAYLIGPGYGLALGKNFSLGMSLFFSYHREKGTTQETVQYNGAATGSADYFLNMAYLNREDFGLKPKLGLIWSPSPRWSLGFSMAKQIHLYGSGKYEARSTPKRNSTTGTLIQPSGSFSSDVSSQSLGDVFSRRIAPFEFALGGAFFPSDRFLVSLDLSLYSPDADFIEQTTIWTWNAGLGFEWFIFQRFPLRWGFYTNHANAPAVVDGQTNQATAVDMYGGTLGFAFVGAQSSISLNGSFSMGKGEGQIVGNSAAVQDVNQSASTFYLSASYQL